MQIILLLVFLCVKFCAPQPTSQWFLYGSYDQYPNYGIKGVQDPLVHPGRNAASGMVYISSNLWLFGGYDQTNSVNRLWRYSLNDNEWTWMGGSTTTSASSKCSCGMGTYCDESQSWPGARNSFGIWTSGSNILIFGGSAPGWNKFGDIWEYSTTLEQWRFIGGSCGLNISANYPATYGGTGHPGARGEFAVSGDFDEAKIYLFGGIQYNPANIYTGFYANDLWIYDISTKIWKWLAGSNVGDSLGVRDHTLDAHPSCRRIPILSSSYDGSKLLMYGGISRNAEGNSIYPNDMWEFAYSTKKWAWLHGSDVPDKVSPYYTSLDTYHSDNTPGYRYYSNTFPSSSFSNKLIIFSGDNVDMYEGAFDDMWSWYSGQWAKLTQSPRNPPLSPISFHRAGVAANRLTGEYYLYGGADYYIQSKLYGYIHIPAVAPTDHSYSHPTASNPTNFINISWAPGPSTTDCEFHSWKVTETLGPNKYFNYHTTRYNRNIHYLVLFSLNPHTTYHFKVTETCAYSLTESPPSEGITVTTLERSASPTSLWVSNRLGTKQWLKWTPTPLNYSCEFERYALYRSGVGEITSCGSLNSYFDNECLVTGLLPGVSYSYYIKAKCSNYVPYLDSLDRFSEANSTLDYRVSAPSPFALTASNPTHSTVSLSWSIHDHATVTDDCIFSGYVVRNYPSNETVIGCNGVLSPSCTASSLAPLTSHSFQVQMICSSPDANSEWSEASSTIYTFGIPASPPNVTGFDRGYYWLIIYFTPSSQASDCDFDHFSVFYREDNSDLYIEVVDCDLIHRTDISCNVSSLNSNTTYWFTIQEVCTDPSVNSDHVNVSMITSVFKSEMYSTVNLTTLTNHSLLLNWDVPLLRDCAFHYYNVLISDFMVNISASECNFSTIGSTSCEIGSGDTNLESNTLYNAFISVICWNNEGNSDLVMSNTASTMPTPSLPPIITSLESTNYDAVRIYFYNSNNYYDCEPYDYEFYMSENYGAYSHISNAFSVPSILIDSLYPLNWYSFKARVLCLNPAANSIFSEASDTIQTPGRQCGAPFDASIINKTKNSAVLHWSTPESHSCSPIEYHIRLDIDYSPAVGYFVIEYSSSLTHFTFTSLNETIEYYAYVKVTCSNPDYDSEWSDYVMFKLGEEKVVSPFFPTTVFVLIGVGILLIVIVIFVWFCYRRKKGEDTKKLLALDTFSSSNSPDASSSPDDFS